MKLNWLWSDHKYVGLYKNVTIIFTNFFYPTNNKVVAGFMGKIIAGLDNNRNVPDTNIHFPVTVVCTQCAVHLLLPQQWRKSNYGVKRPI